MVRAILEGRKTHTRRFLKNQPRIDPQTGDWLWVYPDGSESVYPLDKWAKIQIRLHCPYGKVGDRLWVRETLFYSEHAGVWSYQADNEEIEIQFRSKRKVIPSIHMPRAASRIMLEITDICIERLNDISEEDAKMEGVQPFAQGAEETVWRDYMAEKKAGRVSKYGCSTAKKSFESLWESINGKESWELNPLVWVITFKRVEP